MKLLAAYIMRGRMQATLATSVAALLALLLPPLSYFSGAAVALVTLRVGPNQGLVVVGWSALAVLGLGLVSGAGIAPVAVFLAVLWLPVWALAVVLRRSADLRRAVLLAGVLGAGLVLGIYLMVDDPAGRWVELLQGLFGRVLAENPPPGGAEVISEVARVMTGIMAAALALGALGSLFLARWWQAQLYNPGGFREEFHSLRLGRKATGAALGLTVVAALGGSIGTVAAEVLIAVVLLFALQGIAAVHGMVGRAKASGGWLVAMYLLLLFALPQTAVTLAVVGLVDNWFDFRRHVGRVED